MTSSIKGKKVSFDECYLHVELVDGRIISTPLDWYPDLQRGTLAQLRNCNFICRGTGIEWPDIDYHLSIDAMFLDSLIRCGQWGQVESTGKSRQRVVGASFLHGNG